MIDGLKPYTEYKESGLPWVGKLPASWNLLRAKFVFREVDERSMTGKEELLSVSHITGVTPRSQKTITMFLAKSNVGHKVCRPNDLVINTMWAWMAALGVTQHLGIVSPAYGVYRPFSASKLLPRFADAMLRTPLYAAEYLRRSTGVNLSRLRLYPDHFLRIPLICPPPDEQAAIVRFLDHANAKIERAIRAKRKLIALLNEQKQAIIHRAVTRGLDPSAKINRCENRWFPELPEGWKAITLRRVISATIDGPHFSPNYLDSGIPFLSARNVKVDRWSLADIKYISEEDYNEFCKRVRPEVGDVLYTKGGTTGVARAVDLTFSFQVWVHIAVLKLHRDRIAPEYLAFCLNSPRCYEQAQLFTRGATNQDLGLGRMKNIELPLPPALGDQLKIVEALKRNLANFDAAITRAEREIALLRESRTTLTADVVTGKLDTRDAAKELPATAEPIPAEDGADTPDDTEDELTEIAK